MTSRQPILDASKSSRNEIVVPSVIGATSAASNAQTMRSVDSPALPAGNAMPASTSRIGVADPATEKAQVATDRRAARLPRGRQLGCRQGAIRIGIERLPGLEGRDLGLVDDDVEQHPRRLDPDPRVVVDREVAERMRQCDASDHQDQDRAQREAPCEGRTGALIGSSPGRRSPARERRDQAPAQEQGHSPGRRRPRTTGRSRGRSARRGTQSRASRVPAVWADRIATSAPAVSPALSSAQASVS